MQQVHVLDLKNLLKCCRSNNRSILGHSGVKLCYFLCIVLIDVDYLDEEGEGHTVIDPQQYFI